MVIALLCTCGKCFFTCLKLYLRFLTYALALCLNVDVPSSIICCCPVLKLSFLIKNEKLFSSDLLKKSDSNKLLISNGVKEKAIFIDDSSLTFKIVESKSRTKHHLSLKKINCQTGFGIEKTNDQFGISVVEEVSSIAIEEEEREEE